MPDAAMIVALAALLTSFGALGTLLINLAQKRLEAKKLPGDTAKTKAEARQAEADGVESISNAAIRVSGLIDKQNRKLVGENMELKQQVEELRQEMVVMRGEQNRLREGQRQLIDAFNFLCQEVEPDYPEAVKIARQKAGIPLPPQSALGAMGVAE